ncbi:MAG: CpXC domain-containing protein [Treponemataceae bacterium]|nr:CpXC domain-containing protein [Treponemataceae bacterium]
MAQHQITCQCEYVFTVDIPEQINLDVEKDRIDELYQGTFLTVVCPSCDTRLKPEFPILIEWPTRQLKLYVIPEFDRAAFYLKYKKGEYPLVKNSELVIGYPEAIDRIMVVHTGLDPLVIEAIKYYLLLKADETNPHAELSAWFSGKNGDQLEFHIHGLKTDEVAVTLLPYRIYEKTLTEYRANPQAEPFVSLRFGPYLSVQNLLRPEIE